MPDSDEARCLLCGGGARGPAFPYGTEWNGRTFHFLGCGTCGATFIHPVPTQAEFGRMYARSNYHAEFYDEVCDDGATSALSDVAPLLEGRRLLDFGCGNGAFLIAATAAGFEATGVELDDDTIAQAARNSARPVHRFEDVLRAGTTFDVIHLGDVLEHLPDPAATMRSLQPLLSPEGVFFVEGPLEDNKSLVFAAARTIGFAKRLRGRATGAFTPFHLTRVGARAQRRFFEKTLGCDVLHFKVFETGWPYSSASASGSAGDAARRLIARTSIAAAPLLNAAGVAFGNRFTSIVRPRR